jgi:hypothetical protein
VRPQQRLADAEAFLQIVVSGDDFDNLNIGPDRLSEALDPLVEVECPESAGDDAHLAGSSERVTQRFTLDLARGLVVGADVHDTVAIRRVGVERHHQDALAHAVVDDVDD